MKKTLLALLLSLTAIGSNAAVRFNPYTNMWEGNICMNNAGWQIVNWQPLGTICWLNVPGYGRMQGVIINS